MRSLFWGYTLAKTTRREWLARTVLVLVVVFLPTAPMAYQALRADAAGVRVVDLTARAPADGGWHPDTVRVNRGERVRLRIASADVVHGFAIPALGVAVDAILPGHVADVEFTADQMGRFAFACTRWCSPDHWRMRGTIEVVDPANPRPLPQTPSTPPLYARLNLDLDAVRPPVAAPPRRPSAARGAALALGLAAELRDPAWVRTHSPQEVFARLRAGEAARGLSDADLWDVVASVWQGATTPAAVAKGQELYARDCAACHGEGGKGDSPAGVNLPGRSTLNPTEKRGPADFSDASRMLSASDALLQGKALRGGMGTGMPEWGSLYSEEDLWAVVSYLRTFVFDYGG